VCERERDGMTGQVSIFLLSTYFSDYPACSVRKQFRRNIALNAVFVKMVEQCVVGVYSLILIAVINKMFYIRIRIKILRNITAHR
jgi:hypothetical protein